MECKLQIDTGIFDRDCDGCGAVIVEGEFYLGHIDSCCGQCYRSLCLDCVKKAHKMVQELNPKKEK